MNPSKTKKIRKLLAALSPKDEAKLLAANLADDLKEIEKKIVPQKNYSPAINDLRSEMMGWLNEVPDFTEIKNLRLEFETKIKELEQENIEPIQTQMQELVSTDITTDENLREELEKKIKDLRREFLNRLNNIGGGSMNRQIKVAGVDVLTRYTDINYIAGTGVTFSTADDSTNKRVNITISAPDVGTGDVVGPASAVGDRVVFFDSTSGKLIKDSGLTLSGTNTGDQTTIVGLTGTKAQFDTAVTDGNFLYVGDVPTLASGVYTPADTAHTNLTGSDVTMTEAQYMRVGSTVTVSGRFTGIATLAATATSFEITLPVASNLGAAEDVAGTAFCGTIAGMGAEVIGVVANDTAKIFWVSSDISSRTWSFIFSYQII